MRQFTQGKRVLDIGCGHGFGSNFFAKDATFVMGVDSDEVAISYAKRHYKPKNLEFVLAAFETSTIEPCSFDTAISSEVIEHVNHPERHLAKAKDALKARGTLILTTPNLKHQERLRAMGLPENPFHKREFYPVEIYSMLTRLFRVRKVYCMYSPSRLNPDEWANEASFARYIASSKIPRWARKVIPTQLKDIWLKSKNLPTIRHQAGKVDDYRIDRLDSIEEFDEGYPIQIYECEKP